jgi:hypothetical protein
MKKRNNIHNIRLKRNNIRLEEKVLESHLKTMKLVGLGLSLIPHLASRFQFQPFP